MVRDAQFIIRKGGDVKLGILVTTTKYLDNLIGITHAANAKGHEVSIFVMDEGVKLLRDPGFTQLCTLDNVVMSHCNHSASEQGVDSSGVSKEIVTGSQYNNAMMNNQSDRVVVL